MSNSKLRAELTSKARAVFAELAELGKRTTALTWAAAETLRDLRETFPAGPQGMRAFLDYVAQEVPLAGSEARIRALVDAADRRQGLPPSVATLTEAWAPDMIRALPRDASARSLASLVRQVTREPYPNKPSTVRRLARERGLASASRGRKSSSKRDEVLVARLTDRVRRLLHDGHDPLSLAAGAQLADRDDIARAIIAIARSAIVDAKAKATEATATA